MQVERFLHRKAVVHLVGLFCHQVQMAVPSQLAVCCNFKIFHLRGLFQLMAVDEVRNLYGLGFMGYPDVFTFVWVKQYKHCPLRNYGSDWSR